MKKIMVLVILGLFTAGAMLAYAADAPKAQPQKEENLFKIIQDSLQPGPGKERNKLRNPLPTVSLFQNLSDGIAEGSAKAKQESLR